MSIQIPCPECGRELRLPDRSLLGRKGKCPKCNHTFILAEPAAITLELARPETVASAKPQAAPQQPAFPDFLGGGTPATAVPENPLGFPGELRTDDSQITKSPAARLKARQKKDAQKRNIAMAIGGVIVAVVVLVAVLVPRAPEQPNPAGGDVASSTPSESITDDADSGDTANPTDTKYAKLGSPTKGKPIELKCIPYGTQVVLNLHPADLWKDGGTGEELRYCLPPLAKLIETTLTDLFKRKPAEVEELLICLLPGPRGSMPGVAAVAHMVDEQKRSQLIEQLGQRVDTFDHPFYVSGDHAYMIVDQKTISVCPLSQAQEMVEGMNKAHPSEQIDPLLPTTDRDRQISFVFTPMTLGLQDAWFPENVRPFIKNSLDWLGSDIETVSWSFHVTDELFYSDLHLRNKSVAPKKFERDFKEQLTKLGGELVSVIEQMNPTEQGKRMVIGRIPAMVEVFSMATIVQRDKTPHQIQLITPLPDRAAPNLMLGTLLAWDESTRTDFSKAKPTQSEGGKLPALVADRLKMKIDVDYRKTALNEAFTFVGDEIRTPFRLDGDSLKAGAFTQNIAQEFKMDGARAQDVILKIFQECQGINANPEKNLVIIVDETKKDIYVTTTAGATKKGLTPYVFAK